MMEFFGLMLTTLLMNSIKYYFSLIIMVCSSKLHPEYFYNSIRLNEAPLTERVTRRVVIMRVFDTIHAFVSLHQKDKRLIEYLF